MCTHSLYWDFFKKYCDCKFQFGIIVLERAIVIVFFLDYIMGDNAGECVVHFIGVIPDHFLL
jgi:hypothetical protein